MTEVRCPDCNRLLGKVAGSFEIRCPRCKALAKGLAKSSA